MKMPVPQILLFGLLVVTPLFVFGEQNFRINKEVDEHKRLKGFIFLEKLYEAQDIEELKNTINFWHEDYVPQKPEDPSIFPKEEMEVSIVVEACYEYVYRDRPLKDSESPFVIVPATYKLVVYSEEELVDANENFRGEETYTLIFEDLRPPVFLQDRKILYLSQFEEKKLKEFLGFQPNKSLLESWTLEREEVIPRLKFLNQIIRILPAHWRGFHINTPPELVNILMNKNLSIARVFYRGIGEGSSLYFHKTDGIWSFNYKSSAYYTE